MLGILRRITIVLTVSIMTNYIDILYLLKLYPVYF
jgi:hypothetical protein